MLEFLRAAWWTLKSWRRAGGPDPFSGGRPGADDQWPGFPHPRGPRRLNDQWRSDEDEARGGVAALA